MITYKPYDSNDNYFQHQSSKIDINPKLLKSYSDERIVGFFMAEFAVLLRYIPLKSKPVLCMGARRGAEVAALHRLSMTKAIGIDVNPGPQNPESFGCGECAGLVEKQDFHSTSFPDNYFGMVYCNCLDHCRSLIRVLKEARRILDKENGTLVLRLPNHRPAGTYETCMWGNYKEVLAVVNLVGFDVVYCKPTKFGAQASRQVNVVATVCPPASGTFDRRIICPGDISATEQRIQQYANYYKTKYDIVKSCNPRSIIEIGVRAGYSAWAFMQACPNAKYTGIDAENGLHGGRGGPWTWWAAHLLEFLGVEFEIFAPFDTQTVNSLPVGGDFYHIDGDHTKTGVMHDLDVCFKDLPVGGHMLVDDIDYEEAAEVRVGVKTWLKQHSSDVQATHILSLRGEMLIQRKEPD